MPGTTTTIYPYIASSTCTTSGPSSNCVNFYRTTTTISVNTQSEPTAVFDIGIVLGLGTFMSLFVVFLMVYVYSSKR